MSDATPSRLMWIEEVSETLRVPVQTLRYWRQHGRGPKSARIGSRVVYRESDVQAWLDEQFEAAQ